MCLCTCACVYSPVCVCVYTHVHVHVGFAAVVEDGIEEEQQKSSLLCWISRLDIVTSEVSVFQKGKNHPFKIL